MRQVSTAAMYGMVGLGLIALSGCGGGGSDDGGGDPTPNPIFTPTQALTRMELALTAEDATAINNGADLFRSPEGYYEYTNTPTDEKPFFPAVQLTATEVCIDLPSYPTHQNMVEGELITFRECSRTEISAEQLSNQWQPVYMEDFTADQAVQNAVTNTDNSITFNLDAVIDTEGDVLLYMNSAANAYGQEALVDVDAGIICANFLSQSNGIILQVTPDTQAPAPYTTQGLEQFLGQELKRDATILHCTYNLEDWQTD